MRTLIPDVGSLRFDTRPPEAMFEARIKALRRDCSVYRMTCGRANPDTGRYICHGLLGIATRYRVTSDWFNGHTNTRDLDADEMVDILRDITARVEADQAAGLERHRAITARNILLDVDDENNEGENERIMAELKEMSNRAMVYSATTRAVIHSLGPSDHWSMEHPHSGFRREGDLYHVIKTQRRHDGTPRTNQGRAVGRRTNPNVPQFASVADHLQMKTVRALNLWLPAAVTCPDCGVPIWTAEPNS